MVMFGIATITLIAGMVDDLRSRKVHNTLILLLLPIVAFSSLYFRGIDGMLIGVGAMLLALILTIPLFAIRVIGGGDVKLFGVFALALDPQAMFWTLIYSFFWGSLFGVTRAVLSRQILALVRNTTKAASRQKIQAQEIHKIPYTFALLLGWLTQLTFMRAAGLL